MSSRRRYNTVVTNNPPAELNLSAGCMKILETVFSHFAPSFVPYFLGVFIYFCACNGNENSINLETLAFIRTVPIIFLGAVQYYTSSSTTLRQFLISMSLTLFAIGNFLLETDKRSFIPGMAAFATGHILLSLTVYYRGDCYLALIAGLALTTITTSLLSYDLHHSSKFSSFMAIYIFLYNCTLAVSFWRAFVNLVPFDFSKVSALLGVMILAASDFCLALNYLETVPRFDDHDMISKILHFIGLYCVGLSLANRRRIGRRNRSRFPTVVLRR